MIESKKKRRKADRQKRAFPFSNHDQESLLTSVKQPDNALLRRTKERQESGSRRDQDQPQNQQVVSRKPFNQQPKSIH